METVHFSESKERGITGRARAVCGVWTMHITSLASRIGCATCRAIVAKRTAETLARMVKP